LEFADWLRCREGSAAVDLAACTFLHTAILQTLLALEPNVLAVPRDPFLARWVAPLLKQPAAPVTDPKPVRRRAGTRKSQAAPADHGNLP
jgi:hypothetical protein